MTNSNRSITRTTIYTLAVASAAGLTLWLASPSASAGTYITDCLDRVDDPATGQKVCIVDTPKGNPTKCCKIGDDGNIDYDDCGGVVITKSGYWCVKGDDYVGVYCKANPDGNSETCTNQPLPQKNQYTPECKHSITSASGLRVCADREPGLPQGFYCCETIEGGQIDESSCSPATAKQDSSTGTTELTCNSTLLACAPESDLVTWCTAL